MNTFERTSLTIAVLSAAILAIYSVTWNDPKWWTGTALGAAGTLFATLLVLTLEVVWVRIP